MSKKKNRRHSPTTFIQSVALTTAPWTLQHADRSAALRYGCFALIGRFLLRERGLTATDVFVDVWHLSHGSRIQFRSQPLYRSVKSDLFGKCKIETNVWFSIHETRFNFWPEGFHCCFMDRKLVLYRMKHTCQTLWCQNLSLTVSFKFSTVCTM